VLLSRKWCAARAGLRPVVAVVFRREIDQLLEVPDAAQRSSLFHLKAYPPEARRDDSLVPG
jgi:hypothetical protein